VTLVVVYAIISRLFVVIPSVGRYCDRACLFVRLFMMLFVISRKVKVRLLSNLAQMLNIASNFTVYFSEVKVKVQGSNLRIENLPLVMD